MQVLKTPRPSITYRIVSHLLVFPLFRGLFRGRTYGNENVPSQGAVVVVANHGSQLDPPLLGHALGRPVAFMAKAELFRIPLLGGIQHRGDMQQQLGTSLLSCCKLEYSLI